MLYKYYSFSPSIYNNEEIISIGDLLEIKHDLIINITTGKQYKVNEEIIKHVIDSCIKRSEIKEEEKYCIPESLFIKLQQLGIISEGCREYNIGESDYSKHVIQPWSIWLDYDLNPWDADIVKRVLRTKSEKGISAKDSRMLDYEKIIHICKERIRQLTLENE